MKTIALSQSKQAIVDDEDYEELSKYKWHAGKNNKSGIWYAQRTIRLTSKKCIKIRMHRQLMDYPYKKEIDHINHNGLDNRRSNLRICSHSQNMKNTCIRKNNSSGLMGVCWDKRSKKWMAYIRKDYKRITIGLFGDKDDAGHAVDKKALELFGEFAILNFSI